MIKKNTTAIILNSLIILLSSFLISCEEDMTHNGIHQNYDTDRYNPNFDRQYAPIPPERLDNSPTREEDFQNDIDEIRSSGLASYVNNQVTPYQGKPPCGYRHISPADIAEYDEKKECIPYNRDQYGENGGAQLAAYIKEEAKKGTAAKKAAFFRAFGPLAVKMQDETGYPASALLSQWAEETGWGVSSRLLRKGNGIGGHSCFKRKDVVEYDVFRVPGTKKPGKIKASCTYNRPSNEGAYYLTFETLEDSAYAQVQNILYNPRVQKNYGAARLEVFNSVSAKRKANPNKVIDGLVGYAAFPPTYRKQLKDRIK
ncbi:MAG: glucosaminidase domain-containing protein, partial [Bacteriovoracaceae bacterium]|nr:glucosaminidase domain-containing protein [Bacteriovoracaceae bacterium]